MTWGESLENINYIAVVVGTLATLALGAFWYSPKVLGKSWAKLVGLKQKDLDDKDAMPFLMANSIIFYFIASVVLAALMQLSGLVEPFEGLTMGAIMGFAFAFGPLSVTYGFAKRKYELTLIDGGYMIVALAASGWVIGLMS